MSQRRRAAVARRKPIHWLHSIPNRTRKPCSAIPADPPRSSDKRKFARFARKGSRASVVAGRQTRVFAFARVGAGASESFLPTPLSSGHGFSRAVRPKGTDVSFPAASHIDSTILLHNRSISAYLSKRTGGKKHGRSRALEYQSFAGNRPHVAHLCRCAKSRHATPTPMRTSCRPSLTPRFAKFARNFVPPKGVPRKSAPKPRCGQCSIPTSSCLPYRCARHQSRTRPLVRSAIDENGDLEHEA